MKVQRIEQFIIKQSHPKYKFIDEMCLNSKNLYNEANYVIRQEFISNGKYISYYNMNKEFKTHENYKLCMSQPANCVMRLLDKNWKSFFNGIKEWKRNPDKFLGMPKIPKYLKKDGRFNWMIPNNSCYYDKENYELKFRIRKLQDFKWYSKCQGRLIQVRFVPKGSCYMMEIIYEEEIEYNNKNPSMIVSIDLGVNNFVTMTNNIGEKPIIINGKGIKSINQFYNKQKAAMQSELKIRHGSNWSKRLDIITFKRHCRIKNFIHNASAFIIKWCVEHSIDTIVIGKNDKWKQNKKRMQDFIYIPYEMFLLQLKYKCENASINYIETNESYTSGTSYLDNEEPIKDFYNKERRIKRGLFQAKDKLINSDVNGSLQIMRKVFPDSYTGYGIEVDLTPIIINVTNVA